MTAYRLSSRRLAALAVLLLCGSLAAPSLLVPADEPYAFPCLGGPECDPVPDSTGAVPVRPPQPAERVAGYMVVALGLIGLPVFIAGVFGAASPSEATFFALSAVGSITNIVMLVILFRVFRSPHTGWRPRLWLERMLAGFWLIHLAWLLSLVRPDYVDGVQVLVGYFAWLAALALLAASVRVLRLQRALRG